MTKREQARINKLLNTNKTKIQGFKPAKKNKLRAAKRSTVAIGKTMIKLKFFSLAKLIIGGLIGLILLLILTVILYSNFDKRSTLDKTKDRLSIAANLYKFNKNLQSTFKDASDAVGGMLGAGFSRPSNTKPFEGVAVDGIDLSAPGAFALDIDDSNMTDLEKLMVQQYVTIMEKAAAEADIPPWILYTISFFEISGYTVPYKIGGGMFEKSEFGTVHTKTEVTIDYYTYGTAETTADNRLESDEYIGPFQLAKGTSVKSMRGEPTGDIYNFADAALTGAFHVKDKMKDISKYLDGNGFTDIDRYFVQTAANNSGEGGFKWRYPKDSIESGVLLSHIREFQKEENVRKVGEAYYFNDRNGRVEIYKILDQLGWQFDSDTRNRSELKNIQWTQPMMVRSEYTHWPANISGVRGASKKRPLPKGDDKEDFMTFPYNGIKDYMMNNRQNSDYLWSSYAVGNTMRDTLLKFVGSNITGAQQAPVSLAYQRGTIENPFRSDEEFNAVENFINSGGYLPEVGQKKLLYNWELEQLKNGIDYKDIEKDSKGASKEGKYGEVGYKGSFPIFIQGTGVNNISNIPWKYRGRRTTLGSSGCSIFAAMTMIHGAGYGEMPIPNHPDMLPTFENLAKILDDGPIISNDIKNRLGYNVSTIPTGTDSEMEEVWRHLKNGIPYVVNTRNREVTAYDEYLNPTKTRFTSGGHFIVLVGGYEMGGKRYVEVVQSTNSRAGLAKIDQNRTAFDFDELVSTKVIRSSFGSVVPGYTITGGPGLPPPKYLNDNYAPPIRVESIKKESIEVKTDKDDIVLDLYTVQ